MTTRPLPAAAQARLDQARVAAELEFLNPPPVDPFPRFGEPVVLDWRSSDELAFIFMLTMADAVIDTLCDVAVQERWSGETLRAETETRLERLMTDTVPAEAFQGRDVDEAGGRVCERVGKAIHDSPRLLPRRHVERCAVDQRLPHDERASGDAWMLEPRVLTEADGRKLRHRSAADHLQPPVDFKRPVMHTRPCVQCIQAVVALLGRVDAAQENVSEDLLSARAQEANDTAARLDEVGYLPGLFGRLRLWSMMHHFRPIAQAIRDQRHADVTKYLQQLEHRFRNRQLVDETIAHQTCRRLSGGCWPVDRSRLHSTPIAAAGSHSSISTLGLCAACGGLRLCLILWCLWSLRCLGQDSQRSDRTATISAGHCAEPPRRFSRVGLLQLPSGAREPATVSKATRHQRIARHSSPPVRIDRMIGPRRQPNPGVASGPAHSGPQQRHCCGEGKGGYGTDPREPLDSLWLQCPSIKNPGVSAASPHDAQRKRCLSNCHAAPTTLAPNVQLT